MKVLVVFDHPRRDSFCGALLDSLLAGLSSAGHRSELADLRAENFDPRLPIADEPDWGDSDKVYSPEVLAEQQRISRNDALAFVFPVWWWSFPATTKGWIDRVWNNGWAYGDRKLPHRKALLIGACAGDEQSFSKRGYDTAIRTQLLTGVIDYCGIKEGELVLLYDVLGLAETRSDCLARANELGRTYFGAAHMR
jgi:NAD(P)H dehydrogenase (quinone)